MQVEGQHGGGLPPPMATGARVSNAYPTCPQPRNSPPKGGLMPHELARGHLTASKGSRKGSPVADGDASD